MNKKVVTGGILAGLILAAGAAGTVAAQSTSEAPDLTMAQAIEIALAEVPGQVVESELETEDGQLVFEIEILTTDGNEMELEIDANSGEIVEIEAEEQDDDDEDEDEDEDEDDDDDANA